MLKIGDNVTKFGPLQNFPALLALWRGIRPAGLFWFPLDRLSGEQFSGIKRFQYSPILVHDLEGQAVRVAPVPQYIDSQVAQTVYGFRSSLLEIVKVAALLIKYRFAVGMQDMEKISRHLIIKCQTLASANAILGTVRHGKSGPELASAKWPFDHMAWNVRLQQRNRPRWRDLLNRPT